MTITSTKPGVVEKFDGQMWSVRFGEGVTDIYWLRPMDFRIPGKIEAGMPVTLEYESLPHSGLWKARAC